MRNKQKCLLITLLISMLLPVSYGQSWQGPARLVTSSNTEMYSDLKLTDKHDGKAVAVWSQGSRTFTDNTTQASEFSNGAWTTPRALETSYSGAAFGQQLVTGSSNTSFAIWAQNENSSIGNPGGTGVWLASHWGGWNNWQGWGSNPHLLAQYTSPLRAGRPVITVNNFGHAIAVWTVFDGTSSWVVASCYDSYYNYWDTPITISEYVEGSLIGNPKIRDPKIVADASGAFTVAWVQTSIEYESGRARFVNSILSNRYNYTSGWSGPEVISEPGVSVGNVELAGSSSNDNVIALWSRNAVAGYGLNYMARALKGSNWQVIQQIGSSEGPNNSGMDIEFDSSGRAIAVWSADLQGPNKEIRWNYYDGNYWRDMAVVDADSNGFVGNLAFDGSDNALLVWDTPSSSLRPSVVNVSRFIAVTNSWQSTERISAAAQEGSVSRPFITVQPDGSAVAAWLRHSNLASDNGIWFNVLN